MLFKLLRVLLVFEVINEFSHPMENPLRLETMNILYIFFMLKTKTTTTQFQHSPIIEIQKLYTITSGLAQSVQLSSSLEPR